MPSRTSLVVVVLAWLLGTLPAAAQDDCLKLLTGQVVKALGDKADTVFELASQQGKISEGLAAALRSRPDDAGLRVRQVVEFFGESSADVFGKLADVKAVEGFGDLVVNLGKSDLDAKGASATLRYATSVLNPAQLSRFEFPVPGAVADLRHATGGLFEFKSLELQDYTPFVAEQELKKIRDQLDKLHAYASGESTTVTLVFENAVHPDVQGLFDKILGEILSRDGVIFVNGF